MWRIVLLGILLTLCLLLVLLLIINTVVLFARSFKHSDKSKTMMRIKHTGILLASCFAASVLFTAFTQWAASTPAIRDDQGNLISGSIAELKQVDLNGRREWISIRSHNVNNPVLLFLAGGPGGTQMAAVRHDLKELEKHFVVVNWDQPGSGKSYSAISRRDLTPETYIEDGHALTKYLCNEFGQEKIYLVGESWGSALGIFLVERYPELYHAVIGTGQMVDFLETEIIDYDLTMELAKKAGEEALVETLKKNGPPPYYGKDVTWKSAAYLNYLSGVMARNPEIQNAGYNTLRDLAAQEYGVFDAVNFIRGIVNTFNHVYPQLYSVDLQKDYSTLQVPVYLFLGKHDINAPVSLAEEYFYSMSAPYKEIVWFEHSGHSPWINESDRFVQEVARIAGAEK